MHDSWQSDLSTFFQQLQARQDELAQRREEARRAAVHFLESVATPTLYEVSLFMGAGGRKGVLKNMSSGVYIGSARVTLTTTYESRPEMTYEVRVGFDNEQAFPFVTATSDGVDFGEMQGAAFSDSDHGPNVTQVTQAQVRDDFLRHYKYAVTERERAVVGWGSNSVPRRPSGR